MPEGTMALWLFREAAAAERGGLRTVLQFGSQDNL